MTDLATVSTEIAPYLAIAANSLGTSVLTAAQDRIAERTVTAGEGFFRRLLHRRDTALGEDPAQPLLDADRADALDRLLATLDDGDRRLLAAALTAWLNSPEHDADGFRRHVAQLAAGGPRITYNNPTATGQGSIAAGEIHGTINMGGGPQTRDDA
ncbi:hypothetical protein [Streptomyces sp. WZ-12]|uniref:hypothetical protein n=1 Tax=Streptomyces sp. WZ-12 TaxID=3030210 RepID=UPI00238117FE|nr:hypothetical protein [Streptomyces sp. WZ-12]